MTESHVLLWEGRGNESFEKWGHCEPGGMPPVVRTQSTNLIIHNVANQMGRDCPLICSIADLTSRELLCLRQCPLAAAGPCTLMVPYSPEGLVKGLPSSSHPSVGEEGPLQPRCPLLTEGNIKFKPPH